MNKLAFWAIMLIAVLWGLSYPITRNAVMYIDPGTFAFSRQLIAAVFLLPWLSVVLRTTTVQLLPKAGLMAFCNAICTAAICYALTKISSALTAFFVTLNIMFVPFVASALGLAHIKLIDVITLIIGVVSIIVTFHNLLFSVFMHVAHIQSANNVLGSIFGLIAALAFALQLVIMQIFTRQDKQAAFPLAFWSTVFSVVLLAIFPLYHSPHSQVFLIPAVYVGLLYQGLFSTAIALLLQLHFADKIGATRTAMILNLDLVFASLFGLLNGESLTVWQVIGIGLAVLAAVAHDIYHVLLAI